MKIKEVNEGYNNMNMRYRSVLALKETTGM